MKQGWEIKKLGEVCDFQGGSQPPKEEWIDEPREGYVRMLQIRDFTQSRSYDIEYVKESNRLKYCNEDDVLLGRYGASVGKVLTGLAGAYNVAIMKTMPNKDLLNKSYFKYFLESPSFQVFLQQASTMRAAQAGFSKEDIQDFTIPVPPREEQERIVEELDCLSGVIGKKREQLRELDALAQSIFYQMFGDPITNEKGWEVKKLEEVCHKIGDGLHGTPKYDEDGGVAFINGNNLIDGKIVITDRTLFVNDIEAQKYRIDMDANTILLSINGTLGRTAIFRNENVILGKSACYCNINNTFLITKFVEHLMNSLSFKGFLEDNSSKSTIKNVGLKAIRGYGIILPPLTLQKQFAEKIEKIEQQKKLISQSIKEVEDLFNSRMSYYFD